MEINHKKYYNANAGKNIGRDSLTEEGTQRCNIPREIVELAKEYANSEHLAEMEKFIDSVLYQEDRHIPQPLQAHQEKAKATC